MWRESSGLYPRMSRKLRKSLIFKGTFRKRNHRIVEIGTASYVVTEDLRKKLELRNVLLGVFTVVLSLFYFRAGEKYQYILLQDASPAIIVEGMGLSLLFLVSLLLMFLTVSFVLIPIDVSNHLEKMEPDL